MHPSPVGPTWKMLRPMHASSGRYAAKVVASPPAMIVMAGGRPLTGASSIATPRTRHASAIRRTTAGALVVRSMYPLPGASPARMPVDGSRTACSTSTGPGSDVNTTSLAAAAARGLSAQRAPSSHRLAVASRRRSWTVTWWPASRRHRAIGFPMVPVPTKPSRIRWTPRPVTSQDDADLPVRAERLEVEDRAAVLDPEHAVAPHQRVLVPADVRVDLLDAHPVDDEVGRDADGVPVHIEDPHVRDEPPGARARVLRPGRLAQELVHPRAEPLAVVGDEEERRARIAGGRVRRRHLVRGIVRQEPEPLAQAPGVEQGRLL